MTIVLELLRIIFIMFLFVGAIVSMIHNLYSKIGVNSDYYLWMEFIATFLLFFVLYRNKLQFSGWYKGRGKEKLPKNIAKWLVICAILLWILPLFLSLFLK